MEMLQIVGLCLTATVLAVILKSQRPEMALQISIVAGILILLLVLSKISAIVSFLNEFASRSGIEQAHLSVILKIIGIAYIAEFGSEICRDAGEGAIASKIELGGKVMILVLALPLITSLMELLIQFMP